MADLAERRAIQGFQMPDVKHGEVVAWYPGGTRGGQAPQTATIFRVAGRNVHLITATQGVREAVRHVDDPKLALNRDQRENGAWDFTEAEKARRARMSELEDRVKSLERQLTSMIASKASKPAKPAAKKEEDSKGEKPGKGLRKYHDLRNKAISLGIQVKGNPSTDWLEGKIAEAESLVGA